MAKNSQFALALHILTSMSFNEGRWVSSGFLAKGINTNPVVIRRILSLLEKEGIVCSLKGKNGGFQLALKPDKITLDRIYASLHEDTILKVHDNAVYTQCFVSCQIKDILSNVFDQAHQSLLKKLAGFNLTSLTKKINTQDF